MSGLGDREKNFESKFAHDAELQFKVTARRNKLLGLWAAERFGKTGDDAKAYALEVVESDFEEVGDADVVRKVLGDFKQAELDLTETLLRKEMDRLMAEAKAQIMQES